MSCLACLTAIQKCAENAGIAHNHPLHHRQFGACKLLKVELSASKGCSYLPDILVDLSDHGEIAGYGEGKLCKMMDSVDFIVTSGDDQWCSSPRMFVLFRLTVSPKSKMANTLGELAK